MYSKQRGLTLVELMISLGLSLFLILVVAQFFVSNKNTYRTQQAQADVQERGRYALGWMAQQLRQAGYLDMTHLASGSAAFVASGSWVASQVITGTASSVAVRYFGAANDANLVDCFGQAVPNATASSALFSVVAASSTLMCNQQPVLPGIASMVLSYGIDTDQDGVPDSYTGSASGSVVAVRVCMIVQSLVGNVTPSSQVIAGCDGATSYTPASNAIARVFRTSVYLRNQGQ